MKRSRYVLVSGDNEDLLIYILFLPYSFPHRPTTYCFVTFINFSVITLQPQKILLKFHLFPSNRDYFLELPSLPLFKNKIKTLALLPSPSFLPPLPNL